MDDNVQSHSRYMHINMCMYIHVFIIYVCVCSVCTHTKMHGLSFPPHFCQPFRDVGMMFPSSTGDHFPPATSRKPSVAGGRWPCLGGAGMSLGNVIRKWCV